MAASVLIVLLYVTAGLDHRLQWSVVVPAAAVLAADGLYMLAMRMVFRVFQENGFAAGTFRVEADQRVISSGPYAWVRHPMYISGILPRLATALALGSLWALIPVLLLSGVIVVRLLGEERYLAQNLPGYEDYRQSVRY